MELSGYNPKRQEFDPEYDNDAEQLLAEMEFKDTDTEEERELKLRVLHIYSKRQVVNELAMFVSLNELCYIMLVHMGGLGSYTYRH